MIAIAIDGPSGAGKSTIARALAARLGYIYVDTGALYRAVGLYVHRLGQDTKDPAKVTAALADIQLELRFVEGVQRVFLNGEDVSDAIRMPEISMAASDVSAIGAVRDFLFEQQRALARTHDVVMDGRDIGTVVLPQAQIKIFLTASAEERARRRYDELVLKGVETSYEAVLHDVIERDHNDTHRAVAPLRQAPDAVLVDTTGNTLEQSIELLAGIVNEKL